MADNDIEPDPSHSALKKAINPNSPSASRPVKGHCYSSYTMLYNASMDARYSGYLKPAKRFKYLKSRFMKSREALQSIDSYMKSQGYKSILIHQKEFTFSEDE